MDALRKVGRMLEAPARPAYEELEISLQDSEEPKFPYQDSRSSEDTQVPPQPDRHRPDVRAGIYRMQARHNSQNRMYKITTIILAVALVLQSAFHVLLILNQTRHQGASNQAPVEAAPLSQHKATDCGNSIAEAKAKGCNWDELTKAWLPAECPQYGLDEYKHEGMIYNPHANATGWAYYWEQEGTSNLNMNVFSADEGREGNATVWSTDRQHLTHCAWSLKRTIWSYVNGRPQYDLMTRMHHVNHCVDNLFRRAIRSEPDVDMITTTVKVHFGRCGYGI